MPAKHLLTDKEVRNAKPRRDEHGQLKPYRLHDGGGLWLRIGPTGTRSWQFRYMLAGKSQTASIGRLEHWPLAEARREAERLAVLAAKGEHLSSLKKVEKLAKRTAAAATFATVAADWIASAEDWTDAYRAGVRGSLDNHLAELLPIPVSRITAAMVRPMLDKAAKAAPRMAPQVRQRLHSILDYALEAGLIPGNPLPLVRRRPRAAKNHPTLTTREAVGALLRAADAAQPIDGIRRTHLLLAFTAQRLREVADATWSEFDLEAGVWSIPRSRMKARKKDRGPHLVPLPPQLLAQLRQWRAADGDDLEYVCRGVHGDAPVASTTVQKFYRTTLGLKDAHRPHSWRSVLKTWAGDAGKPSEAIEQQLDHTVGNAVAAGYDRADRLGPRRELMEWYEGQLIAARDGAQIIPMGKSKRK